MTNTNNYENTEMRPPKNMYLLHTIGRVNCIKMKRKENELLG